jgi:hypothetical protein
MVCSCSATAKMPAASGVVAVGTKVEGRICSMLYRMRRAFADLAFYVAMPAERERETRCELPSLRERERVYVAVGGIRVSVPLKLASFSLSLLLYDGLVIGRVKCCCCSLPRPATHANVLQESHSSSTYFLSITDHATTYPYRRPLILSACSCHGQDSVLHCDLQDKRDEQR